MAPEGRSVSLCRRRIGVRAGGTGRCEARESGPCFPEKMHERKTEFCLADGVSVHEAVSDFPEPYQEFRTKPGRNSGERPVRERTKSGRNPPETHMRRSRKRPGREGRSGPGRHPPAQDARF